MRSAEFVISFHYLSIRTFCYSQQIIHDGRHDRTDGIK